MIKKFALIFLLFVGVAHAQTYTIVQSRAYTSATATTSPLTTNQTANNANFAGAAFCPSGGCTSATCPTTAFTDNAGSAGGSGNNTYTSDQNSTTAQVICVDLGSAFNIVHTTSTNTITNTTGGTHNFDVPFAIEVSVTGGWTSPTLDGHNICSGTAITSCTVTTTTNDFCWSYTYSQAQPSAGSGLTTIGTPSANQIAGWLKAASSSVTINVTGTSGATGIGVACYNPTGSAASNAAFQVGGFLVGP